MRGDRLNGLMKDYLVMVNQLHNYYLPDPKLLAAPPVLVTSTLPDSRSNREISKLAVWTVTSAKPGNGVELLRDGREDTYWQSDGSQPHLVNIQFQKKVLQIFNTAAAVNSSSLTGRHI